MNDSYLISQTRCPECTLKGKDRSGDNLAVYSDGHSFCFGCGWHSGSDRISKIRIKEKKTEHLVYLPEDSTTDFPSVALSWIEQYELGRNDLLSHHVVWSEERKRLIFPVFGSEGLLAWQGRSFNPKERKWDTRGDLKTIFHILGKGDSIVLVEDIVSAIKLSRITRAMPLFGNNVGTERFKRLKLLCKEKEAVYIWLDPDMRTKSVVEARRGIMCGLNVHPIFSEHDPKEHSYDEISSRFL